MSEDLPKPNAETYLGDGLYASFDGWHVRLSTQRIAGETDWVALEPEVYRALRAWVASYPRLKQHMEGE